MFDPKIEPTTLDVAGTYKGTCPFCTFSVMGSPNSVKPHLFKHAENIHPRRLTRVVEESKEKIDA